MRKHRSHPSRAFVSISKHLVTHVTIFNVEITKTGNVSTFPVININCCS
ncbi:hypothetical protein G1C95_2184 [Bifidobacterium sp. DSM 109957]|uniref:Uncharacterized protein n=1 Tax=Bifidobacterium oedipodis TaxID=2675322 RepID=A0A7Y0HTD8_9BIFI|nr:hypothetical protein [Bifidobacterium sp. DSM 109957]